LARDTECGANHGQTSTAGTEKIDDLLELITFALNGLLDWPESL
jgi:hypothetical protein